jgi:hypothetical protein
MTRRGFPSRLHLTLGLLLVVIASFVAVGGSSAVAATPVPAWRVEAIANPTAFSASDTTQSLAGECAPCDKYELRITNVGGASSNGAPVKVTDTLPEGVTTSERPSGNSEGEWECVPGGEGQTRIECTTSTVVGALKQAPSLTVDAQVEAGVPPNSMRPNVVKVEGGGAATVEASAPTLVNPSAALLFEFADFGNHLGNATGEPDTQAGGHPNSLRTNFDVVSAVNRASGNFIEPTRSVEDVKDIVVDLPPGLVGDPQAAPQCPLHDLVSGATSSGCPGASQVGWVSFNASGSYEGEFVNQGRQNVPVYNMVPEHGYPAEFGFIFAEKPLLMYASVVGNDAATHVRVSVPGIPASQALSFQGAVVTFFGDPAVQDGLPSSPVAFFTNPSECSGEPLVTSIHADSWQNPGADNADGTPAFSDPAWKGDTAETPTVEGCGALHFNPTMSLTPDVLQAGAPTGLSVNLEVPQSTDPSIPATPDVKNVVVKLPAGVVLSPSAANGLGACSPAQIGLEDNDPPTCPQSSKIATVRVKTPLLAEELEGAVYLAQQGNVGPAQGSNPFNSLLAGYIVVEGSGVVLKIPGKIEANPTTGQLTATFAESPQLPFSDFKLHFTNGPRAPLSNPPACGTYTPEATLSSWSGQTVQSNQPFEITQGENGGACPGSVFAPSFTAGTSNNQAGASSPLSVTFSRSDQDQTLGGITVTMPPGLLGKLAGIPQCPEAQANAGTCSAESELGEATTAVGPGAEPYWVKGGRVYLTGPYNGGPFGLSIVVPTEAGPFKLTGNAGLGKEVVRASIRVNPNTAQITVVSNPLPSILEGIPLQIRTVNVTINRPGFTFNPTNCEPLSVSATITSAAGASAGVSSPFQAANCAILPFKPSFTATTQGSTSKVNGASLVVKVAQKPGEANIHRVDLQLPIALPSRLTTLQKACNEAQFNANPAGCPEGSVIGTATAHTPVLSVPLTGPAILVSHGGAGFPDVEFILQGEGVEIVLDGKTDIKKGITYSKFDTVPDAPISSFETVLPEGPHSILAAYGNLCSQNLVMPTTITGQNGAQVTQSNTITATGCGKPSIKITKAKVKGNTVLVTVTTSQPGTVTVSGSGLKTIRDTLGAGGTHQLNVSLTKNGRTARAHHRKTKVKASVTDLNGSSSKTMTLKL